MFTGIVESTGTVTHIEQVGNNLSFTINSQISHELRVDQSVSHSGVCLTVESLQENAHTVTAIAETLSKTNLGKWKAGTQINLERCVPLNGRLDGHLVQGHVDAIGTCLSIGDEQGSWLITCSYPFEFAHLLIEKGSICVNGISLTAFNLKSNQFSVAIIPYTFAHTNMQQLQPGDSVNLEFDMLGKYLARWHALGMS